MCNMNCVCACVSLVDIYIACTEINTLFVWKPNLTLQDEVQTALFKDPFRTAQ